MTNSEEEWRPEDGDEPEEWRPEGGEDDWFRVSVWVERTQRWIIERMAKTLDKDGIGWEIRRREKQTRKKRRVDMVSEFSLWRKG